MENFEILDLTKSTKWNEYLCRLPIEQQDIYFTPEYYRLYEDLGLGKTKCFVFKKGQDIALYPFLLNPLNFNLGDSSNEYFDIEGAYGYNGLVSSTSSSLFLEEFNKEFSLFCKKNSIIAEFIRFHPVLKNVALSEQYVSTIENRKTVVIDLSRDYSKIWQSEYSSQNRNMIRKAIKFGHKIQILEKPTDQELKTFVDIYNRNMNMLNAEEFYYFNKQYFKGLIEHLDGHVYLFNVLNSDNVVVCTSLFFHFGYYFHYHLSGRDEKADNSANNYLLDRAIVFAKRKGARFFHLGGGQSTFGNDALLKFKSNFSKQTLQFYIGKKIHDQEIYNEAIYLWEKKYPNKAAKYKNVLLRYRY